MSCIGGPITSVEAMIETVNRCAVAYGGTEWVSLAMTGLATVIVMALAIVGIFLVLMRVRG